MCAAADRQQVWPGPAIASVPLVLLSLSCPPVNVIVCGVLNRLEKVIGSAVESKLSMLTAWRSVSWPGPETVPSAVVLTTRVEPWVWKAPMSGFWRAGRSRAGRW